MTISDTFAHVAHVAKLTDLPEDDLWVWWDEGAGPILVRRLDERRYVGIMPLMFTHAIIWGYVTDPDGYEDRWCYHNAEAAITAASVWDGTGDPDGWHRHPRTGRRRPDGDPTKEYVAP